jgi:hypothetical protein
MLDLSRNLESKTLSNLTSAATKLINHDSPQASRVCFSLLVFLVLLTAGFLARMGTTMTLVVPWDVTMILDCGWRAMNGQIPHVDFYSPLGPVTHLVVALGMRLAGPHVSSIACANACVLLVVAPWAWILARTRMSAALSFVFALYVGFMVAATSTYGHAFRQLAYSAIYNRWGVALTALVLIESLGCPRQPLRRWSSVLLGVSTGISLAITLFLKVSFFGVGVMGLLAGAILMPQNRHRWFGLCAGAAAVSLPLLAYLRFDVGAVVRDLSMAARVRNVGVGPIVFDMVTTPAVFTSVYLIVVLWCVVPSVAGDYRPWFTPKVGLGMIVLFLILAQAILSLTNTQPPLATLFPVGSLLVLEAARRAIQRQAAADSHVRIHNSAGWMVTLLIALYFVASILGPDMASLPYSAFVRATEGPRMTAGQEFAAPPLADMLAPRHADYVRIVNDGCELLRLHSGPADRIVTMDRTNPFSFALQRPPADGDALWWEKHSFTERVHPDPERVFEDAAVVMVPRNRRPVEPDQQPILVYSGFLEAHYTLVAESAFWRLYRRRA